MYREKINNWPVKYTFTNGNTGSTDDFYQSNPFTSFSSGISNPAYKAQIAARSDATTPFSGKRYSARVSPGTVYSNFLRKGDNFAYTQSLSGVNGPVTFLDPPTSPNSVAYQRALGQFWQDVERASSAFQGGTFLGELRETLQMIRNPAQSLIGSLGSYLGAVKKHTKYRSKKSRREAVVDTYLEYTFGWQPLVSDIKSAFQAASQMCRNPPTIRVHGYGEETFDLPSPTYYSSVGSGTNIGGNHAYSNKSKIQVILSGAMIPTADVGSFRSQFGFTAEEFVPTLWNLLPYSFVADYFLNISDIIASISYLGTNFSYSCYIERRVGTRKYSVSGVGGLGSDATGSGGGSISWESELSTIQRNRFVPGIVEPTFSVPGVKQGFNIAALLEQGPSVSRRLNHFP